ncbi:NAD(P)H-binding protein [Paenibacillus sp. LHD-38]|uniref:NAD(P)-dependent oxidoreductase n=1 Tax=Paenibacillus sp. LHD-38 TaxID=3072143 RepID=UPI00280F5BBF|nr:NAD(P)H-binding protein [Paenibacillus sp. LHD-38]MDQ8733625.1 NAD(P)H-binding protein [Paenibacillus sp. LHD-38]
MIKIKLLLIGPTGKTGQFIERYLEEKQVGFKRFVRSEEQMRPGSYLGDVRIQQDVSDAMAGVTGVISALNTEGNGTLESGVNNIIAAMKQYQIRRLVTIGTAGILQSELEPHLLRYQSIENKRIHHVAAQEHERVYEQLLETELDWTIICPTKLVQEDKKGEYRVRENVLPTGGTAISFADTAEFAVTAYLNGLHIRERVGIAY